MIHSSTVTNKITVPARRKNTFARSTSRKESDCSVGQRYGGISRTNEVFVLFNMLDFSTRAVKTAATKPST